VQQQYEKALKLGKLETFNQELMLQIMSEDDRIVREEDIRWYKLDSIITNPGRFNFYITTDFATSVSESADFSVLSVWAHNNAGDWFWVDGVCRRQLMDANVNDLFRLAQRYKPQSVGVEVSGQQKGFIPWIQQEMMNRNNYFALATDNNSNQPGIRPSTNKLARFMVVQPWFKAGKMYWPYERRESPEVKECMNELSLASRGGFRSKQDDFIDTISMLPLMGAYRPSELGELSAGQDGMWDMDDYDDEYTALDSYVV
jgi:predicted phage terminase large subunit-like protein